MWRLEILENRNGNLVRGVAEGLVGAMAGINLLLLYVNHSSPFPFLLSLTLSLIVLVILFPALSPGWGKRLMGVAPWKYVFRVPLPVERVRVEEEDYGYILTLYFSRVLYDLNLTVGVLYAEMNGLIFYPVSNPPPEDGDRVRVRLPKAPVLIDGSRVILPAVRILWDGETYFLTPMGSNLPVVAERDTLKLKDGDMRVLSVDEGLRLKFLRGRCDRCILKVVFTLKTPRGTVRVEENLMSVWHGSGSLDILWRPPIERKVVLFRERDVWELPKGTADVLPKDYTLKVPGGCFSLRSEIVVETSSFGRWSGFGALRVYRAMRL